MKISIITLEYVFYSFLFSLMKLSYIILYQMTVDSSKLGESYGNAL